jgi:hypothetical protein
MHIRVERLTNDLIIRSIDHERNRNVDLADRDVEVFCQNHYVNSNQYSGSEEVIDADEYHETQIVQSPREEVTAKRSALI